LVWCAVSPQDALEVDTLYFTDLFNRMVDG